MSRTTKKQIEFEDVQPVPLNLIHGQYMSRRHKIEKGVITQPAVDKYFELREIPTQTGIEQKLVEVDYPITPDYVKSFANSTDYRNDIERAMNEPPRGTNLGDMTALQDITSMDLTSVRELQAKLSSIEKKMQEAQKAQVENQVQNVEEVNNG